MVEKLNHVINASHNHHYINYYCTYLIKFTIQYNTRLILDMGNI